METIKKGDEVSVDNAPSTQGSPVVGIDYKKKFEEERAKREEAEKATYKVKKYYESQAKSIDEVEEPDTEVTTSSVTEVQEIANKNTDSLLSDLIQNEDERNLVKLHLNDIVRSGSDINSIKADIYKARAIANADRINQDKEELIRIRDNSNNMNNTYTGGTSSFTSNDQANTDFTNGLIDPARLNQLAAEKRWTAEQTQKFLKNLAQAKTGTMSINNTADWFK